MDLPDPLERQRPAAAPVRVEPVRGRGVGHGVLLAGRADPVCRLGQYPLEPLADAVAAPSDNHLSLKAPARPQ